MAGGLLNRSALGIHKHNLKLVHGVRKRHGFWPLRSFHNFAHSHGQGPPWTSEGPVQNDEGASLRNTKEELQAGGSKS